MGEAQSHKAMQKFRVVAYDFGIKQNILRLLVDHNCESRWFRPRLRRKK